MAFIKGIFTVLLFVLFFPFLIVRFAQFIARTSMDSQTVRLYGTISEEDYNLILAELRRRNRIAVIITFPLACYIEWLWIQYLYSFFPFFS